MANVEYERKDKIEGGVKIDNFQEESIPYKLTHESDIDTDLADAFQTVRNAYDEVERKRSGWLIHKIVNIQIHTATYDPLMGSSYIDLPKKIKKTKAVINIQNNDDKCFLWSVLAHLHPVKENAQYTNLSLIHI